MPSENPLFKGGFNLKKFNATVINDIWPEVAFFTLVATMVTLVSEKTSTKLIFPPQLLTVLGTVLGLVISFRTSSAYERYQEGRKLWTSITISSRNVAQMIWIHVPTEREAKPGQPATTFLQNVIEKKTMINLVQAFSVSIKHYLRGEPGIYYKDLYPLVSVLPRYIHSQAPSSSNAHEELLPLWHASEHEGHHSADVPQTHTPANDSPRQYDEKLARSSSTPSPGVQSPEDLENGGNSKSWFGSRKSKKPKFDPEQALADVPSLRPLKPARDPPEASLYSYIPILRVFRWLFRRAARTTSVGRNIFGKKIKPATVESNVPLEVTLQLSAYSGWLMKSGLLVPAIAANMTMQISAMQDIFSNLDRIRNTPLPFAYQAHLRMSLWLYLFFLPFQIWQPFGWITIPGTAFASFLLLGFLEIGQEIENPFNYDANDLDLDTFCLSLQRELNEITTHTAPDPHQFIFSAWNQPFAPADRRTAEELCKDGAQAYTPPGAQSNTTSSDSKSAKESVHRTLLRSWRVVDDVTRDKR